MITKDYLFIISIILVGFSGLSSLIVLFRNNPIQSSTEKGQNTWREEAFAFIFYTFGFTFIYTLISLIIFMIYLAVILNVID